MGYGRRTVEQTRSIDISALKRAGFIIGKLPGNWWVHRYKLFEEGIWPKTWNERTIVLKERETLRLTYAPWNFGGRRAYLLCDCGRRVGKLYSPPGQPWRCRHCYDLTYRARQVSSRDRLLMRAQKIRQDLGGTANMLDDFPAKPKGMHWKRYNRLRRIHDRAERSALSLLAVRVYRLSGRLGSDGRL